MWFVGMALRAAGGPIVQRWGDHLLDPTEQAAETQAFPMQNQVVAALFGEVHPVQPDPQVWQHQRDQHEQQPFHRSAGRRADAGLAQ